MLHAPAACKRNENERVQVLFVPICRTTSLDLVFMTFFPLFKRIQRTCSDRALNEVLENRKKKSFEESLKFTFF